MSSASPQISEAWLKLIEFCETKATDGIVAIKVVNGAPKSVNKVSESWMNLVRYCDEKFPFGELTISIRDSCPGELLAHKPKIRFDKPATIPRKDD